MRRGETFEHVAEVTRTIDAMPQPIAEVARALLRSVQEQDPPPGYAFSGIEVRADQRGSVVVHAERRLL